MKTMTLAAVAATTAALALSLVAAAPAHAYVQFVPCVTKDRKQRAAVWFYVNRQLYVYQVVTRLRGGAQSSRNVVQYREQITRKNGLPAFNVSPGFHIRGQWHTRNDGKLRRMPATVSGREGGFGSSPWGVHPYLGTTLFYRPSMKFMFASGRSCTSYSQPPKR